MLVSPLASPPDWTLAAEARTLPDAARYGGRRLLGVRCTSGTARAVLAPVASVARAHDGDALLEVEPVSVLSAEALQASAMGLPEFYLWLAGGTWTAPSGVVTAGTTLASTTDVWLGVTGQDGLARDPRSWAAALTVAWPPDDATGWQDFVARLEAQLPGGAQAPVLLTDHHGAPLADRRVRITLTDGANPGSSDVDLLGAHDGDLQRAAAAAGLGSVFRGGATQARLEVQAPAAAPEPLESQWAAYAGGPASAGTATVRPGGPPVGYTDLHRWFAPQQVQLGAASPFGPDLARLRRGSLVTPFVDGHETLADIVATLRSVAADGGHVNFAGWDFHHRFDLVPGFVRGRHGLPDDADLSLLALTEALSGNDRTARFLVNRFFQIEDTPPLGASSLAALLIVMMILLHQLRDSPVFETRMGRELGVAVGLVAALGLGVVLNLLLADDLETLEPSSGTRAALDALDGVTALWSALPATKADNPLAGGLSGNLADFAGVDHVGVYHQKMLVARHVDRIVSHLGGIDINPNRLDDCDHNAAHPYHDTHARIEGPAALDAFTTFRQRWLHETALAGTIDDPPAQPDAGNHVVQIARTYFRPASSARALPFAPSGDFTLNATLLRAIGEAREFVYIEDQYMTPPQGYRTALLDALARIRKLVVVVPRTADQPFGALHRQTFLDELVAAGGDKVHLVGPVRRPFAATLDRIAGGGRCELREDLAAVPGMNEEIALGPSARVPRSAPFWLTIDGELMHVHGNVALPLAGSTDPEADGEATARFRVRRGSFLPGRLVTEPRAHAAGAAALVTSMDAIYIHSKMMIVDDVFLSLGSANINRRGLFHDGELNVFAMSDRLRTDAGTNVARSLRIRLWADHLGLPLDVAAPLVADPIAGAELFARPYFTGNRAVHPNFFDLTSALDLTPGGSALADSLKVIGLTLTAAEHDTFFDTTVDPTTLGT